jgi:hypothetical protein
MSISIDFIFQHVFTDFFGLIRYTYHHSTNFSK